MGCVAHYPCPDCGSRDNLALYSEGTYTCFTEGCKARGAGREYFENTPPAKRHSYEPVQWKENKYRGTEKMSMIEGQYRPLQARKIGQAACEKLGYQVGTLAEGKYKGTPCHIENYYDEKRKLVGQRFRTQDKSFPCTGDINHLFGKKAWTGGRTIIITEGALDALSFAEATQCKWPVVAVQSATGAKKLLQKELKWLSQFEEIILCFDNDEPGQKAVEACAPLFNRNKISIMKTPKKDLNQCLLDDEAGEITLAYRNRQMYKPSSVLTAAEVVDKMDEAPIMGVEYPFPTLNRLVYGMHPGQFNVWLAGTGMGKTAFMKAITADLIKQQKKVAIFFLEEDPAVSVLDLAGILAGKRFDSPEFHFTAAEKKEALHRMAEYRDLYIVDDFVSGDFDSIMDNIRYLASIGVEYVFLDHLTLFTDGRSDSNQIGEKMSNQLSSIAKELHIHIEAVSHTRKTAGGSNTLEQGGEPELDDAKGTGGIKQYAHNVFALVKEADDQRIISIKKCRRAGFNVGRKLRVKYMKSSGCMKDIGEVGEDEMITQAEPIQAFDKEAMF